MNKTNKKSVLFICSENAARSQMAEALLRHMAGDIFTVCSAGTQPDEIDPRTINTLIKFGVDAKNLSSKNINIFKDQTFDYVITLCNNANEECRSYTNAAKQLAWDLPNPTKRSDSNPFSVTFNELNNRLSMFLQVEKSVINLTSAAQKNSVAEVKNPLSDFEPISFYKSLTDNIRLKTLMLTHYHGELCVCELMEAIEEGSQPKVSRNLAILKKAKVITDRKHGQWVFYRINPELPLWAKSVIAQTTENNIPLIMNEISRLDKMKNRPDKAGFCK
ncbi:MAG: metalloregulator ArsR/SmtB family transcription factor [Colwellia sp.]|nr:metalloregulator ArsR/SmtB family transcription factor [Colwellia sp.]